MKEVTLRSRIEELRAREDLHEPALPRPGLPPGPGTVILSRHARLPWGRGADLPGLGEPRAPEAGQGPEPIGIRR